MKKLFIAIFMLMTLTFLNSNSFAQFQLKSGMGYGLQIDNNLDYRLFQASVTATPQYKIDKFIVGAVTQAFSSDSSTLIFAGSNISYPVWQIDSSKNLFLAAQYLYGEAGKQLIGGSVGYSTPLIELELNVSQEYKSKTCWVNATMSYYLIK